MRADEEMRKEAGASLRDSISQTTWPHNFTMAVAMLVATADFLAEARVCFSDTVLRQ